MCGFDLGNGGVEFVLIGVIGLFEMIDFGLCV